MTIFTSTLNQTAFLFTFIFAGWILAKRGVLASSSATVLSKLENNLFIPALCMGTFIENFTVDRIGERRLNRLQTFDKIAGFTSDFVQKREIFLHFALPDFQTLLQNAEVPLG